jgi:hypothetical protein
MAEKTFTQADMDAVRERYMENTLSAVRITVAEMRSRYDPTFKSEFAPSRPRSAHLEYIDQLGARLAQADAIIAEAGDQARAASALTTTTAGNVVPMASAREIIEAGRKRRGGT